MGRAITKPTLVTRIHVRKPDGHLERQAEHSKRYLAMEEDIRAAMQMARITETLADVAVDEHRGCGGLIDGRRLEDIAFAAQEARRYANRVQTIFSFGVE